MTVPDSAISRLLADCDQCVKCGLCLPACPTYNYYKSESDSPRGRISLIQGLARGDLNASDLSVVKHLDQCLGCAACETACPSGVSYIELLDTSRALFKLRQFPKWQLDMLSSSSSLRKLLITGKFIPKSVGRLLPDRFASFLKLSALPSEASSFTPKQAVSGRTMERIAIFSGCAGSLFDRAAINAFTQLLQTLDFDVIEPSENICCGALHLHEGYPQRGDDLLHESIETILSCKPDKLVYFTSACGAQLKNSADLGIPLVEATAFLSELIDRFDFAKSDKSVAVHTPCSLLNQSRDWPAMKSLLEKVAGDQLIELPGNAFCCGSAGLHMVKHPDAAEALLSPKLTALKEIQPDILLTSNTGCAMHFRQGIAEAGMTVQVMHPAEWISLQILEHLSLSMPV